ncbi:MAG: maleylpyruvate isomerase family mycothiol-dependent enzyme [Acidimicrobiia bacterium]
MTDAATALAALHDSHGRLAELAARLGPGELRMMSYASEWTVADVLSHLGSGAEIGGLRLRAAAEGAEPPGRDVAQPVWDRWNAKTPEAKAADALVADAAFLAAVDELDGGAREGFRLSMGRMELDLAGFLTSRLSEQTLHGWDIAVALDPTATLPRDATELVLPTVGRVVRFTGKPVEPHGTLVVHTTDPDSDVELAIGEDGVVLSPAPAPASTPAPATTATTAAGPDITLPGEAFVRLVYGRLDRDHTPAAAEHPRLDQLRRVFPGV